MDHKHPVAGGEVLQSVGPGQQLGLRRTASGHQLLSFHPHPRTEADKDRNASLQGIWVPTPGSISPKSSLYSPVQQGMVQVLTQALQDLVMVPDSRGLVLTRCKVALQLEGREIMLLRKVPGIGYPGMASRAGFQPPC